MASDIRGRLQRNTRERARLLQERDNLILEARAENIPVTHIAEMAGLSAMQVHRIISGRK